MATATLLSQPHDVTPEAQILATFRNWQAGHRTSDMTAADAAEAELLAALPGTPEGVEALLWVALAHLEPDAGDAPERGDLKQIEAKGDQLDWGARFIIAALRAMAEMRDRRAHSEGPFGRVDTAHLETLRLAAVLRAVRERVHAAFNYDLPSDAANVVDDAGLLLDMAISHSEAVVQILAD